ncbi:oxygen-dependent protoporphyrinogen oxidase [Spiromyces aspiralis]|uniref:Oxygen-dependent protoporphyrinogen oxidase n=1 Tax=Spiromyces aspiralis TaxID=68401 RepID=A0ACC1HYG3_9FUNG|nr:oxygen-dependent protoporphyrinogen oxidase [Spiromyces aspiralis]
MLASMPSRPTIAILGGGISGLSAAWYFSRQLPRLPGPLAGARIVLIEREKRLGGWVQSDRADLGGGAMALLERGPRTLRVAKTQECQAVLEMVADLGLQDQVVAVDRAAPAAQNRFLFFDGRLRALPAKPVHLLTRFARPLWGAPYAVLHDLLAPRNAPPAGPAAGDDDESVSSLVSRRLGSALDDNVVSAVINGIYAADTRVLSSRAVATPLWRSERSTGSALLGLLLPLEGRPSGAEGGEAGPWQLQMSAGAQALWARLEAASMYSFRGGMQTLTDQLAERLANSPNVTLIRGRACEVLRYERGLAAAEPSSDDNSGDRGGGFSIGLEGGAQIRADYLVSALPAAQLGSLLESWTTASPLAPPLPRLVTCSGSNSNSSLPYTDIAVVNLVYKGANMAVAQLGFGFLVPRAASREVNALGVVFDSCMLPEQDGGADISRFTVMLGGTHFRDILGDPATVSRADLHRHAMDTMRRALGVSREPVLAAAHVQRQCIPAYPVGYVGMLEEVDQWLTRSFGGRLSVVGAAYGGPSVPSCILHARQLAEQWAAAAIGSSTGGDGLPWNATPVTGLRGVLRQYCC